MPQRVMYAGVLILNVVTLVKPVILQTDVNLAALFVPKRGDKGGFARVHLVISARVQRMIKMAIHVLLMAVSLMRLICTSMFRNNVHHPVAVIVMTSSVALMDLASLEILMMFVPWIAIKSVGGLEKVFVTLVHFHLQMDVLSQRIAGTMEGKTTHFYHTLTLKRSVPVEKTVTVRNSPVVIAVLAMQTGHLQAVRI